MPFLEHSLKLGTDGMGKLTKSHLDEICKAAEQMARNVSCGYPPVKSTGTKVICCLILAGPKLPPQHRSFVVGGVQRLCSRSGRFLKPHPRIWPRKPYANLGRAAGQDDEDVFAVIWNALD
jgi:hypothetical protein